MNTFPTWVGSEVLMEKFRSHEDEVDLEKLYQLINEAESEPESRFSRVKFGVPRGRDAELDAYLS